MKCLRCGHCCIHYDVIILIDPDAGFEEENVEHKPSGTRCRHLTGDKPGEYACSIHDHPNYQHTPCADFAQIEDHPESPCRMGEYILKLEKSKC